MGKSRMTVRSRFIYETTLRISIKYVFGGVHLKLSR